MIPSKDNQFGWDDYWKLESVQPAYPANGRLATLLKSHWATKLPSILPNTAGCVLEVAAGSGIVSGHIAALAKPSMHLIASDLAFGAARHANRLHQIDAVNCNAQHLPFASESMHTVCSQFGIEYAGRAGLAEAARVTTRHGHLGLVVHWRDGMLHKENTTNRAAASAFLDAGLLPLFAKLAASSSDAAMVPDATLAFVNAVKKAESVLHGFGPTVAGGSLLQVYREVATMHGGLDRYSPADIHAWCHNTINAIDAYAIRMQWMLDAAYSPDEVEAASAYLVGMGFQLDASEPIIDRERPDAPVAWWLCASRVRT